MVRGSGKAEVVNARSYLPVYRWLQVTMRRTENLPSLARLHLNSWISPLATLLHFFLPLAQPFLLRLFLGYRRRTAE